MSANNTSTPSPPSKIKKFGTFLGVYTPSVLTILGLIMYLRFGWVLGNVGLGLTIVIVLMASSITFITSLSASAIATNMRVGAGGEYFLISRSLGLELGGAIGIPLYLCRTLSITFYCFGLAEALVLFWPPEWGVMPGYMIQLLAAGTIVFITLLSGKSANLVLKMQIPIFIAVVLSVVALAIGVLTNGLTTPEMTPTYRTAPEGFWYVFAVFFPAVTGFTAGIGMSGDLANPQKSIPTGTLLAVLTGAGLYILIPILLSISIIMSPEALANSGVETWTQIAFLGAWIVYPAILGAILSSAFGSILGGPRVLQALSNDGLAPKYFSKLSPTGQPTRATWISGLLALAAVGLGGLNDVAKLVSILFLTLYVMVNLSAVVEQLVGDPSYRPTIKVPWWISILGAIGAIMVMFLVSPTACVVALVLVSSLYFFLKTKSIEKTFGDVRGGLWQVMARYSLLQLQKQGIAIRNWRPRLLLFVRDTTERLELVQLASWFGQNRGMVTACQFIVADSYEDNLSLALETQEKMRKTIQNANLEAFSEVNIVQDFEEGAIKMALANGIVGLKPNTIMFGWSPDIKGLTTHLSILRAVSKMGKSGLIARFNQPLNTNKKDRKIDIWWGGQQNNGDLMLLLAYLLRINPEWEKATLTIRSIVGSTEEQTERLSALKKVVSQARIRAKIEVKVRIAERSTAIIMQQYSGESDVVFIGMGIPEIEQAEKYASTLDELSKNLKTTVFVHNAAMNSGVPVLLKL